MYKAGTGTFLYSKKSAKQRKLEIAKNSLPSVPYAVAAALKSKPIMHGLIPPMMPGSGLIPPMMSGLMPSIMGKIPPVRKIQGRTKRGG
jgi:hypothetical protein